MKKLLIPISLLALSNTGCLAILAAEALDHVETVSDRNAAIESCVEGHSATSHMTDMRQTPDKLCMIADYHVMRCAEEAGGQSDFRPLEWDECLREAGFEPQRLWSRQPYGERRKTDRELAREAERERIAAARRKRIGPGGRRR